MQKRSLFFSLIILISYCSQIGCVDNNDTKYFLTLEKTAITFDSFDVQEKEIAFETNIPSIQVEIPKDDQDWCTVEITGNLIKISLDTNPSFEDTRQTIISLVAKQVTPQTITIRQLPKREKSSEKEIISFMIPSDINNLEEDIEGIIDHETQTITISTNKWIPNIRNIIVKFDAIGTVYINDKEQISEVTPNSFLGELVYLVKAEDGTNIEYNLIAEGPMFTGLPIISIDIDDGLEVVEKIKKLSATFYLINPQRYVFDMNKVIMTIRGRGNYSWGLPKKPYRIDFPKKTSLFGLPEAKKWVLIANHMDPTLLMNDVAFELGRRFGLQYNHSSIHVELFVNGKHRGNYQLTEQNEIGEGRVDIDEENGFLVELDSYYDEEYKFKTTHLDLPVMVTDPDLSSESEMDYIKEVIQGLEDALFEPGFPNDSYENYTDVNSLINFMLINELVQNKELSHPKSTFCYKDANTKLMWGPLWDFDWAFGFDYGKDSYFNEQVLIFKHLSWDERPGHNFFCKFMEIPSFRTQYKARWKEMKPQIEDIIVNYIDKRATMLDKSQIENFKIPSATPTAKKDSYENLILQMKNWLLNRVSFIDRELDKF